jgi:hypothetical protein
MTFSRSSFPHILSLALMAGVALVPVGCGGDGVNSYNVPKSTDTGRAAAPAPAAGEYRMLGAMFPADEPQWFFKYSGPSDEVAKYEADFDKLIASVKLGGPTGLEFAVPDGWERRPGREGGMVKVFATVNTKDNKQEVSITQSAGGVEANLSRWVGQIGRRPTADDVSKFTKVIDAGSLKGRRVDLTGPNNPATKRAGGPMVPPGHP